MRNSMIRWISRVMYVEEMTIFKDYSNVSTVNMPIATPIAIRDSTQTSLPQVIGTVLAVKNFLEIRLTSMTMIKFSKMNHDPELYIYQQSI